MTIEHNDAHKNNVQEVLRTPNIELGSLAITTGGAYLRTDSAVDGNESLSPRCTFDDLNPATKVEQPFASELFVGVVLQNDDQGEVTGTEIIFYPNGRTSPGTMTQKYYAKCGTVIPTTPVQWRLYRGNSAGDMTDENLMFEGLIPADRWQGNFQESSFTITEVATGRFTGMDHVDFLKDQEVIIRYNCDTPLSLRTQTDQLLQYYRADLHTITDRVLLDQFTSRSPYLGLDFTPDTYALVTGDNIITSWIVSESNYFDYDEITGYYTYTGQDMPFFRASTEFGGVSNTPNCYVQMAIDVDRSGVVTRKLGMPREFDGSNAGSLGYTSRAFLENGDKIRVVVISSKDAPSFEVTYLTKFIEKVS